MNSLIDIARAIAEAAQDLQPDAEIGIPVDAGSAVHVLRSTMRPELVVSVSHRAVGRSREEQDARREALLRLAADTRWTDGLVGGLDADGGERITVALGKPMEATQVEALLVSLLDRLGGAPSAASADAPLAGAPAAWLRA